MQHVAHRRSDEIHQLRAEIERLRKGNTEYHHHLDAQDKENERLRVAIKQILDLTPLYYGHQIEATEYMARAYKIAHGVREQSVTETKA